MNDEKIEQRIDISDSAQAGNITLVGKMVYVMKNPARWQEATWTFIARHGRAVLVLAALQAALVAGMLGLKDRYLISWGAWALAAGFLTAATWGWATCWGQRRDPTDQSRNATASSKTASEKGSAETGPLDQAVAAATDSVSGASAATRSANGARRSPLRVPYVLMSGAFTVLLAGVIGWQGWQIVYPARFDAKVFGIAVAELGEGPSYRATGIARQLSDQVYEFLLQNVAQKAAAQGSARSIAVHRIGVISSSEQAHEYGDKIGAEMVIWGQLVTAEPHVTTVRFQVLEMLDRADDPEFPFVMPVTAKSTDVSVGELNLTPDAVAVKEAVADQSRLVSSYIFGLIHYLDQNFGGAVREFRNALGVVDSNPAVSSSPESRALLHYYLGTAVERLGLYEEGQAILSKGATYNPEEPAFPFSLAFGYRHMVRQAEFDEQLARGFTLLNRWLSTHPHDTTALYARGMAYSLRGDTTLEAIAYQELLEQMPEFYVAHINLGKTYAKLGRFEDSEKILTQAIGLAEQRGSNSGMAWLQLALTYEHGGQAERARGAYGEATTRLAGVWWPHFYYAQFLETNGDLAEAGEAYARMLETATDKAEAHRIAGEFARRTGDLAGAVIHFQQALDASADPQLLCTRLGETYAEMGDSIKARAQFERAIAAVAASEHTAYPFYPYSSYAWFLYQGGEYEQAAGMYEQALARGAAAENTLTMLGRIYSLLGDCVRAQDAYSGLLELGDVSAGAQAEAEANLERYEEECSQEEVTP